MNVTTNKTHLSNDDAQRIDTTLALCSIHFNALPSNKCVRLPIEKNNKSCRWAHADFPTNNTEYHRARFSELDLWKKPLDMGVDFWYNIHMTKTITGGFKNPIPPSKPDTYNSYCWFTFPHTNPDGKTFTIRALFPPICRNDTYGGMTDTQIRTLAFERLNELYKDCGADNVTVEMIS